MHLNFDGNNNGDNDDINGHNLNFNIHIPHNIIACKRKYFYL
jgi:hypothetical protein